MLVPSKGRFRHKIAGDGEFKIEGGMAGVNTAISYYGVGNGIGIPPDFPFFGTWFPLFSFSPQISPFFSTSSWSPTSLYHDSSRRQSIVNRYCDNILYSARLSNKFCFKASLSIYNKKGSKCLPFPTSSCLDKGLFFRKNKTISLHLLTSTKHASLMSERYQPTSW